jgi:DNA-binding response OmpR family regulator
MRIFIVEARNTWPARRRGLGPEGYAAEVVGDGSGRPRTRPRRTVRSAVVDWMLPTSTGVQVVKRLRAAEVSVPVLMLTARAQVEDRVEGPRRRAPTTTSPSPSPSPNFWPA